MILRMRSLHLGSSGEVFLEVSNHMLPGPETLKQESGSLETIAPSVQRIFFFFFSFNIEQHEYIPHYYLSEG